jgi:uncharacterized protein YdhG (YjbR/CyaY superfamily)
MAQKFATIDEYIGTFPEDVQTILTEIRRRVHAVVPGLEEAISYQMPTMNLDGRYLVYFAGWKHHVSIYPIPTADEAFQRELAPYKAAKGTLKFPLDQPIPAHRARRGPPRGRTRGRLDRGKI